MNFEQFPSIPRWSRDAIITEKIDGTNASIHIYDITTDRPDYESEDMWIFKHYSPYGEKVVIDYITYLIIAGSRKGFVYPTGVRPGLGSQSDNFGFAAWVFDNKEDLVKGLGVGRHYGEWWGQGIQRKYNQIRKRFSLFNTKRWAAIYNYGTAYESGDILKDKRTIAPMCCDVVPIIWRGSFDDIGTAISIEMKHLNLHGSVAAPGFDKPEGIVIYHTAANLMFKKTFEKDQHGKG